MALSQMLYMRRHKDEVVSVLSRAIGNLAPYVLVNKRDELLPMLLLAIQSNKDPVARDKLTHMLFNLIKRPDDQQRRVITLACMMLAESIGTTRCEVELLPCCWEQLTHKYPERRTLVAETCGVLARYVKVELRASLVLSILQQLVEDTSDMVRQAVVRALAVLATLTYDEGKFHQFEALAIKCLADRSDRVVKATLVCACWMSILASGVLHAHLSHGVAAGAARAGHGPMGM